MQRLFKLNFFSILLASFSTYVTLTVVTVCMNDFAVTQFIQFGERKMTTTNLKRAAQPISFYQTDSSSDSSTVKDPFSSSDDDKDLNFELPLKKMRTTDQHKPSTSDVRSKSRVLKNASGQKKNLTASQRIARLKNKTEQYNKISQSKGDLNSTKLNQKEADLPESLDHMFDMATEYDIVVNDSINGKNTDGSSLNETANGSANNPVIVVPSTPEASHESYNVVELILQMQNQLNDLTHNVIILRKQVARLEVKSMQTYSGISFTRPGSSNSLIDSGVCFDFEGALSREGLPLKTCVEINEFELKLKNDEYRTKLVRILTFI